MKTKQFYLTGILAVVTVINGAAHDKEAVSEASATGSKRYEIELPRAKVEPDGAGMVDLSHLDQAVMNKQLQELSTLISMQRFDLRVTEEVLDSPMPTSVESLVKLRQVGEKLATWKSNDAAITEMGR